MQRVLLLAIIVLCAAPGYMASGAGRKSCPEKKLVTFNAGLSPSYVPHYDERLKQLIPALKSINSDVICLQDVYYGKDLKDIVMKLMYHYPYSYSALHDKYGRLNYRQIYKKPCVEENRQTLTCLYQTCYPNYNEMADILSCAVNQCKVLDLTDSCLSCVLVSGVDHVMKRCLDGFNAMQMNIPGLLILSRRKIWTYERRPYIPGLRPFFSKEYTISNIECLGDVMCTHLAPSNNSHLSALAETFFIDGTYQNLFETLKLLYDIRDMKNVLLLGDFNTGPSIPSKDVDATSIYSFQQYMNKNLRSPYSELVGEPTVSYANNSIARHASVIADHVFTRGYTIVRAKRLFDEQLPGKDYSLSDHYGVEVTVESKCYEAKNCYTNSLP